VCYKIFHTCYDLTVYSTPKKIKKAKLKLDILNFILYFKVDQFMSKGLSMNHLNIIDNIRLNWWWRWMNST